MIENYKKLKAEEARNAAIATYKDQIQAIAALIDINLEEPEQGLSLKERINDLEIAICELMDLI